MLEMVCDMLKHDGCRAFICIFAGGYQPFVYEIVSDCLATCRLGLC